MKVIVQKDTATPIIGQTDSNKTKKRNFFIGRKKLNTESKTQNRPVLDGRKVRTKGKKRQPGSRQYDYHWPHMSFADGSIEEYRKTANIRPNMLKHNMQRKIAKAQKEMDEISWTICNVQEDRDVHITIQEMSKQITPITNDLKRIMTALLSDNNVKYIQKRCQNETNQTTLEEAELVASLFIYKMEAITKEILDARRVAKTNEDKQQVEEWINWFQNETFATWTRKIKKLRSKLITRRREISSQRNNKSSQRQKKVNKQSNSKDKNTYKKTQTQHARSNMWIIQPKQRSI